MSGERLRQLLRAEHAARDLPVVVRRRQRRARHDIDQPGAGGAVACLTNHGVRDPLTTLDISSDRPTPAAASRCLASPDRVQSAPTTRRLGVVSWACAPCPGGTPVSLRMFANELAYGA